jgi:uncharacterized protein
MASRLPKHKTEAFKIIIIIFVFYILLPIAILLNIIPFNLRFITLSSVAILLFLIRPSTDTKNIDLGITSQKLGESVVGAIPITLFLALPILVLSAINEPRYDNSSLSILFYVFYVLISCPFQEFAYRGYLLHATEIIGLGKWARIAIAAVLYSFVHIIYRDGYILVFTLMAGIAWNIHYDKFRNIISVTLSHSVLGVLTILLGFV